MAVEDVLINFSKALPQLFTWALVVLGWLVITDQTEYRELAKVAMSRITGLREAIRKIEADAIAFHTTAFDNNVADKLMRDLSRMSAEISDLRKSDLLSVASSTSVINLRQAVTTENFTASVHTVRVRKDDLIAEVEQAADVLDRQLMLDFSRVANTPRPLRKTLSSMRKRF